MASGIIIIVLLSSLLCQSFAVFNFNNCLRFVASYNETSASCYCNDGYRGVGDLCCEKDNDFSLCSITGDPWLSSYDGTKSALSFPCAGRVSVVNGITSQGKTCTVEVTQSSIMVNEGAMYPNSVVVAYNIAGNGRKLFKFVKDTIQRPMDPQAYKSDQLYSKQLVRTNLDGEMIHVIYDVIGKKWIIAGCSTKITFRAALDDKALQDRTPGVCISVAKASISQASGDIADGDLCSVSSNYQPNGRLITDLLVNLVSDLSNVGVNFQSVQPGYQSACTNLEQVARIQCGGDVSTAAAKCAPIFYNSVIRTCLTVKGASGPKVVQYFGQCMEYQCVPNNVSCDNYLSNNDALKSCIPSYCSL